MSGAVLSRAELVLEFIAGNISLIFEILMEVTQRRREVTREV